MQSTKEFRFVHYVHEYERSKSNKEIYRCLHPQCSHYKKREFLVGKEAICHKCKNKFILTWLQLRNKRPVCEFCTKSPKSSELQNMRELTSKTLDINELPEELKKILIDSTLE